MATRYFHHLSSHQAANNLKRPRATLVWPFGACEQHGPHLPLATDAIFAQRLTERVLARLPGDAPIWSLPAQAIGFSPEHSGFPGTLTLPASLLIDLVSEVGSQLAAQGAQRLVILNAHGGQIGLLQAAARQLRQRAAGMAVHPCFLWSGIEALEDLIPADELVQGLHAGLMETSLMLHLEPNLVAAERPAGGKNPCSPAAKPPNGWSLEGDAPWAWLMAEVSENGVIGDSRGANPKLGTALSNALENQWLERFSALLASDWPPRNISARS